MVWSLVRGALVALLLLVPVASAQANDNFADARYLPFGVTDSADNTTATTQPGETLTAMGADYQCENGGNTSQADRTLWWWVTGTGRPLTVTTDGSNFDTHLGIFSDGLDGPAACQDADPTETLTIDSVAGQTYRIQVGGCAMSAPSPCAFEHFGLINVRATSPAAPNDARANATPFTSTASGDNWAATEEAGENVACDGRPFGRTVWYRWSAPSEGNVTFSLAHPGGALAVYRPDGTLLGCDANGGDERVGLDVPRGDLLVQVGGIGTHNGMASDSRQGPFTLSAAFQGSTVGGREDARYPVIASRARVAVAFYARWSRIRSLTARDVPAGAKVQVRCSGRSCPFRRAPARTLRRAAKSVSLLTASLRRKRIVPTTTIEVRVTRAGHIGSITRFRFTRLRHSPLSQVRCLPPGRTTPQRTC
jgi:hypothetical protein